MTEFEWESNMDREQAARLLRQLADGLAGGGTAKLEHEGFELKVPVADEVELEIEVQVSDGETKVELEIEWTTSVGARDGDDKGAPASPADGDAPADNSPSGSSQLRAKTVAEYAQEGLPGNGPRARITGPNILALRAALVDAGKTAKDYDVRDHATKGGEAPLPADVRDALRSLVKESAHIDGRTFYGQKVCRMLTAIRDDDAGDIK